MRRHLNPRIRSLVTASVLAITAVALAVGAVFADGSGGIIPH